MRRKPAVLHGYRLGDWCGIRLNYRLAAVPVCLAAALTPTMFL